MTPECAVGAIVLAAGAGSRVGVPKCTLKHNGLDFLSIVLSTLREAKLDPIVVITRTELETWVKERCRDELVTINPTPDDGMFSSVMIGFESLTECDGVLVWPVDVPFVRIATIQALIGEFHTLGGKFAVKPQHQGVSGHPLLLPYSWRSYLLSQNSTSRLNDLLQQMTNQVKRIPVDDPSVTININTPDDIRTYQIELPHE